MIVRSRVRDRANFEYRGRVAIANTDVEVLEGIRDRFGGMLEHQPPRKSKWNHSYQLVWSEGMAAPLLELLLPHLRIKQQQARLVLEFIAHKHQTCQGHAGKYFSPLPKEILDLREAYYQRVSELNARGTA